MAHILLLCIQCVRASLGVSEEEKTYHNYCFIASFDLTALANGEQRRNANTLTGLNDTIDGMTVQPAEHTAHTEHTPEPRAGVVNITDSLTVSEEMTESTRVTSKCML